MASKIDLDVRTVTSWADVEMMRRIRNSGAERYSTHREHITHADQVQWWTREAGGLQAYLFSPSDTMGDVAFGLLRYHDGVYWTTVGVLPEAGGRGIGSSALDYLVMSVAPVMCRAIVLLSNVASIKIHRLVADGGYWVHIADHVDRAMFRTALSVVAQQRRSRWLDAAGRPSGMGGAE